MWPDRETDYEEFADKLFAALKLKTESPAGAESGNEAPK
jgi:hypothetical protein